MSKVRIKVDLDIDQLKEIVSRLSEDEKEELFLGLTLSGVELYKNRCAVVDSNLIYYILIM